MKTTLEYLVVATVISTLFFGMVHWAGCSQSSIEPVKPAIERRKPQIMPVSEEGDMFLIAHRAKGGDTLTEILDSHRRDFEISNEVMVVEAARLILKEPGARSDAPGAICPKDLIPVAGFTYGDIGRMEKTVVFHPDCDEVYMVQVRPEINWPSRKTAQIRGINLK